MDENNCVIYGLEIQARALTTHYGECNDIQFLIATNSLKPNNQLHLLKYNEEQATIDSEIYKHAMGEVWKIRSSMLDSRLIGTCFNAVQSGRIFSQAALLTFPEKVEKSANSEFVAWEEVEVLKTEAYGENVRALEFHPGQKNVFACVVDNNILIFDRTKSQTRVISEINESNSKATSHVSAAKWSHHHQGNQFLTVRDCCISAYDIRDAQHCSWKIEKAHSQLIRDIDCNPNKQCHIVTGGDDGYMKVWDYRMPKQPVFSRSDHAHWVWCVRFNTFHDQLLLSSSSDCKVMLTSAGSVSSEVTPDKAQTDHPKSKSNTEQSHRIIPDGLLQTFDQHEDSVYCVDWSNVDPWTFASLSYDGRVIISKVPKQLKYQIIL